MRKQVLALILFINLVCVQTWGQGLWTQKNDFAGWNRAGTASFSIGNKGYLCAGSDNQAFHNDLWEYDPLSDTWTQMADLPAGVRESPSAFSIGSTGYVGMGYGMASLFYTDFWQWDQISNTWNQIADYPGEGGIGLSACVAFTIGNKGYVGTGGSWATSSFQSSNEFWEYEPSTDSWTQKANFPGVPRWEAVGFAIGNKGYIGTGDYGTSFSDSICSDFWEYDPVTDSWMQKANLGIAGRALASAFVIGTKGFVATGADLTTTIGPYYSDLWQYDPQTDSWTSEASYPGGGAAGMYGGATFSIGSKGYLGTGARPNGQACRDFWEYDPSAVGIDEDPQASVNIKVFPNPATTVVSFQFDGKVENRTVAIWNVLGQEIWRDTSDNDRIDFNCENFTRGSYSYHLQENGKTVATGIILLR